MNPSYSPIAEYFRKLEEFKKAERKYTPSAKLVREPSLAECEAKWHPKGYYKFFCIHDRHVFIECRTCNRSARDGEKNREEFLKNHI